MYSIKPRVSQLFHSHLLKPRINLTVYAEDTVFVRAMKPKVTSQSERLKFFNYSHYMTLSKSRIVFLVGITAACGYFIGYRPEESWSWARFLGTVLGTSLVAAGSSALNQVQERALDGLMPRTKKRPLVTGALSLAQALAFISLVTAIGLALLAWTEPKALWLGILAIVSYNGFYTTLWKRKLPFAAIPGALPGALPVWMGYVSANPDYLDPMGVFVFLVLFYWQMPHFWVLAFRYQEDYALGNIPTLPVARTRETTMRHIQLWLLGYIALFVGAPTFLKLGIPYLVTALVTAVWLLFMWRRYVKHPEGSAWISFFLAINLSLLLIYVGMITDLWSTPLIVYFTS